MPHAGAFSFLDTRLFVVIERILGSRCFTLVLPSGTIPAMSMRVLLFASYADAIGASEVEVDLPAGTTAGEVVQWLRARHGEEHLPPSPLVAVNQSYARLDTVIGDGDEVAIIPPVAGG